LSVEKGFQSKSPFESRNCPGDVIEKATRFLSI
jgi:hypothetical protein